MNKLDQLKSMIQVVADNGGLYATIRCQSRAATPNPSLLLNRESMATEKLAGSMRLFAADKESRRHAWSPDPSCRVQP